jgi:hypothetical protein
MPHIEPHALAELIEFGEADAFADTFAASPNDSDARVAQVAGACLLLSPAAPDILFNRVLGLGLREPVTEATLDRIAGVYRDAGVGRWAIQIAPIALSAETEEMFASFGLQRAGHWEKVYRKATSDVHVRTDLTVRRIGREMAETYAGVFIDSFGMHPALKPALMALVGRSGAALHGLRWRDAGGVRRAVREGQGWLARPGWHTAALSPARCAGRDHGHARARGTRCRL